LVVVCFVVVVVCLGREDLPSVSQVFKEKLLQCDTRLLSYINPLNAELNPICHLLALLGVYHFLHVSRIRVNRSILSAQPFVCMAFL
jgi:hypothetical protein